MTQSTPSPIVLTVAVSASALFDMTKANDVFRKEGEKAFMRHMESRVHKPLKPGAAHELVRKMLAWNNYGVYTTVAIVSRMNPFAMERVYHSMHKTGLEAIYNGKVDSPGSVCTSGLPVSADHLRGMQTDLFLSTNAEDVGIALNNGIAGAIVLPQAITAPRDLPANKVVFAYDFDRVIGLAYGKEGDAFLGDSEDFFHQKFEETKDASLALQLYQKREADLAAVPAKPGPFSAFFLKTCAIGNYLASREETAAPSVENRIVTLRSGLAFARATNTLRKWGVQCDFAASCGRTPKVHYVSDTDIFFDDTRRHIEGAKDATLAAHVPWTDTTRPDLFKPAFDHAKKMIVPKP